MDSTDKLFDIIFGPASIGATAAERAATSDVQFVRGQDELSFYREGATGRVFTAKEALDIFGEQALCSVAEDGSAILASSREEPARTLRTRREALGLDQKQVAKWAALDVTQVEAAEDPRRCNPIHNLDRIARVLSLDERRLTFSPGAGGDRNLAYRLKSRGDVGLRPNAVVTLSEASWAIARESEFYRLLGLDQSALRQFETTGNYGSAGYPAHKHADFLAAQTRQKLKFDREEPIPSLRELCSRLCVPIVRAILPRAIAGATIENNGARGIVVNCVDGSNNNVWVQRATVAHELGHLLYDPDNQLSSLIVDTYDQIEKPWDDFGGSDYVEARANAFAVELLAPKAALRSFVGPSLGGREEIAEAIRKCMDRFGLSFTAMRYHLWNAFDRSFDIANLPHIDPNPTDEWIARERYADDYFPIKATPQVFRGPFAGYLVRTERDKWTTAENAAFCLHASVEEYKQRSDEILGMYPA